MEELKENEKFLGQALVNDEGTIVVIGFVPTPHFEHQTSPIALHNRQVVR